MNFERGTGISIQSDGITSVIKQTLVPKRSNQSSSQGIMGPTGPSGGTGPTGPRGPTGLRGPTGMTGPTGPMGPSGQDGPTGPPGPTGAAGPTGPPGKGSFVETPLGIYELICIEGARPWFVDIVRRGQKLSPKFEATIIPQTQIRFPSGDGEHELVIAVKTGFKDWYLANSNKQQLDHARKFWGQEYLKT